MIADTLNMTGMSDRISFSYLPVNHVFPINGSFQCFNDGVSMGCPDTEWDSCLVRTQCWQGNCSSIAQKREANYLKCYEGPYANQETSPDASRRGSCMKLAGIDSGPVQRCLDNTTLLSETMEYLNTSKTAMYERIKAQSSGPPGLFPHIFLNGKHLFNDSWTSLVRILCDAEPQPPAEPLAGCMPSPFEFAVEINSTASVAFRSAIMSESGQSSFLSGLTDALDYATSSLALPHHFLTDDDALPPGTPSYVNLKSTTSMSLHGHVTMPTSASAGTAALTITLNSASLAVFATPALAAVAGAEFRSLLPWSLQTHKFPLLVLPGDIVRSYVVHAE